MENIDIRSTHNLVIRKSAALMFVRLVMFELLSGILYVCLRIGLSYFDIAFDSEFSLTPLALVKSLLFMLIEIIVAGVIILKWLNNYYVLSSNEMRAVTGILSKREINHSLRNIQSVSFEQGIIGRIFDYGRIKIYSPALQQELFLTEISHPRMIANNIKNILASGGSKTQFLVRK